MVPCLHFQGALTRPLPRPLKIGGEHGLFIGEGLDIHLYLPIYSGELKHFYKKYRNYYYLPQEDRAIHKSVAAFVDRGHRTRATAATCYQKASGLFLPQPAEIITPVFRRSYDDRTLWFRLDQDNPPGPEQMHAYARAMLQTFI